MQFKVPQNIDKEDKILGPLTFVQFIYVLLGGGFVLLFYSIFDLSLFIVLSVPTIVLTAAFALVKIQDQPFSRFFIAFLIFLKQPKRRVWQDVESSEDKRIADSLFADPETSKKQTAFQALISGQKKAAKPAAKPTGTQPAQEATAKVAQSALPSAPARKVPVKLVTQGGS